MRFGQHALLVICLSLDVASAGQARAQPDCAGLVASVGEAIAAKDVDGAKALEKKIYLDESCSSDDEGVKERIIGLEEDLATDPSTAEAIRSAALGDLRRPAGWLHDWATAAKVADRLFQQRRFTAATELYDRAIALARDPMSDDQKRALVAKASAAKLLASNDEQGGRSAEFVDATRGPGGSLEGIYSQSMRSVVPEAVPLPINFVFNSTEFTPVGKKAAAELGDFLRQQHVSDITLIGHTDERGPDTYNMKLSEARARSVADFLAKDGVATHVTVVGKGWHDPLDVSRLPFKPNQDETWALNRRVEFLR